MSDPYTRLHGLRGDGISKERPMALDKLKKDELAVLGEVLGKALVHHDPDDDRTYDLGALANTASRNPSIASALIGEILKNVDLGALLAKIVEKLLKRDVKPPKPTPAPPPVVDEPEEPNEPEGVQWPSKLESEVVSITNRHNTNIDFALVAGVIKPVATDALDDRTLVYVRVGADVRMDPGTPTGGCVLFRARDAASGEVLAEIGGDHLPATASDGKPTTAHRIENGVGTREDRYRKESGTAVVFNLKRKGGPIVLEAIALDAGGQPTASVHIATTPEIR